MVKRKKERMDEAELQDQVEAELEESKELPQPEALEITEPQEYKALDPEGDFSELVGQVLRGEWGTGQDRRRRLAEAGHDHVAIQREIVRRINNK